VPKAGGVERPVDDEPDLHLCDSPQGEAEKVVQARITKK